MNNTPISTIVKLFESLPESLRGQAAEHLISYLEGLIDNAKWGASSDRTKESLIAAARINQIYGIGPAGIVKPSMVNVGPCPSEPGQLQYQKDFLLDESQFILLSWLRGGRKTSTAVLKIVLDCIEKDSRGERTDWVILGRGDRQAFEIWQLALDYCASRRPWPVKGGSVFPSLDVFASLDGLRRYNQHSIEFPNGSRIIALPSNLDTVRAYSANTFLDEFSTHENGDEIYTAVFASARDKYKVIIASTPRGHRSHMFNRLATVGNPGIWSRHVVDVYEAARQGLPIDIEKVKTSLSDPQAWAQEYELQFE
jgi:phage FluMu gp28-like protein